MRSFIAATTAIAWTPMLAEASEKRVFADVAVSSSVIDRGEQIAPLAVEASGGVEVLVRGATLYGAIYRLTPLGPDGDAFDDETDYTVGVAWEGKGYSGDLSANWLTYPGEETDSSLELVGSVTLEMLLAPMLAGFRDANTDDWGLEISAGPTWEAGDWELYARGRAGFVTPGDGSDTRSYGGVEAGAARAVSEAASLGFFARAEFADEDSFARHIDNGAVTDVRRSGVSAGVSLSIMH